MAGQVSKTGSSATRRRFETGEVSAGDRLVSAIDLRAPTGIETVIAAGSPFSDVTNDDDRITSEVFGVGTGSESIW